MNEKHYSTCDGCSECQLLETIADELGHKPRQIVEWSTDQLKAQAYELGITTDDADDETDADEYVASPWR